MAGFSISSPNNMDDHIARGPVGLSRDPVDWLPSETAVERFHALQQRVTDCHALLTPSDVMRELYAARAEHQRRIDELLKPAGLGGKNLSEDHPSVQSARKQLNKALADLKRAKELDELREGRWRAAGAVASAVSAFLLNGIPGGTALAPVDDPPLTEILKKGESIADAIERLQRRVRELKADLHRTRSSPYPSAVAKAKAREQIEAMADMGAPDCSSIVERLAPVGFATKTEQTMVHNVQAAGMSGVTFIEMPDTLGLVCWAFRDQIIARISASIDADSDNVNALSEEQRQEQEAQIGADILATEREEAALIWKAQSDGLNVEHRSDCNPLAILGLRLLTVGPAALPSGSTPGHALEVIEPWTRR